MRDSPAFLSGRLTESPHLGTNLWSTSHSAISRELRPPYRNLGATYSKPVCASFGTEIGYSVGHLGGGELGNDHQKIVPIQNAP
jgi:hypothetical protein